MTEGPLDPKLSAHFWGDNGFPTIHNIFKDVPDKMDQLEKFLKDLAKLEEEYAKNMERALKNITFTEIGTLGEAIDQLVNYNKQKAENAQHLSHQIHTSILEPFSQFKQGQKQFRNSTDLEASKVYKDHEKLKNQFQKSIDKYEKEVNECEKLAKSVNEAQQKNKPTNELLKLNNKLQKQRKERENTKKEGLDITYKLNNLKKVTEEKLCSAYDNFQKFEEGRYEHYQGLFKKFCTSAQPEPLKLLKSSENISFTNDLILLIKDHKTSSERTIGQYHIFPVKIFEESDNNFPEKSILDIPVDNNGTIEIPIIAKASILFDYVGADEYELDLKEGETVLILEKDKSGWWVGESGGRVALFPANYVNETNL